MLFNFIFAKHFSVREVILMHWTVIVSEHIITEYIIATLLDIIIIINLKSSDKKLWNKLLVHSYSYNGITT